MQEPSYRVTHAASAFFSILTPHSALFVFFALAGCGKQPIRESPLSRVSTIVVIYAENRSFDNLFGMFPGADGVASATTEQKTQLDHDGQALPHLPPVYDHGKRLAR